MEKLGGISYMPFGKVWLSLTEVYRSFNIDWHEIIAEESESCGTDCGLQLWNYLFSTATGMEKKKS